MTIENLQKYDSEDLTRLLREKTPDDWNNSVVFTRKSTPNWVPQFSHSADLRDLEADGVRLQGAILVNADLENAKLKGTLLGTIGSYQRSDLSNSNLMNVNFEEANLQGAILNNADLRDANLYKANLIDVDLRDADLSGAQLDEAQLSGAQLDRTNLSDVDLTKAYLQNSNLEDAYVEGSYFTFGPTRKKVFVSGVHVVGEFEFRSLRLFTIKDPGYLVTHGGWVGYLDEFAIYGSVGWRNQSDIKDAIKALKEAVDTLSGLKPELDNPDRRTAYLLAEAERTGQSPVDIILGDD